MGQPPAEPVAPAAPPASPAAQPAAAQPASVRPSTPQPVQPTARRPGAAAPGVAAGVAAASAPPPAPPEQPPSVQPAAVRPAAAAPRPAQRPAQAAETPPPRPGDLICGDCGIGNDPVRKFCRRCGTSLAKAVVHVEKVPWWRRIIPKRDKKPLAAGERPKSMAPGGAVGGARRSYRRVMGIVFQVLVIAAVVGMVVGYAVVPPWQGAVNDAIGSIRRAIRPDLIEVHPADRATGPAIKGHPAQSAFDLNTETYYAEDLVAGLKPALYVPFSPGTVIDKILVTSGAGKEYRDYARPRILRVEVTAADGSVTTKDLELADTKDLQVFDIAAHDVASVGIAVVDVYTAAKSAVAITEIEFQAFK
jgi:hypothetical protein